LGYFAKINIMPPIIVVAWLKIKWIIKGEIGDSL
jgi:hypothetical protein